MALGPVSLSTEAARLEAPEATLRFGLIALATDLTSEGDLFRLMPPEGARIHVSRVAYENPTTPENLAKMAPRLTKAADLLVPDMPLAAICYSCTSASVTIGDDEVAAAIGRARPGVPVVTPSKAARLAFEALGVRRLAILTPYTEATSRPMAAYFDAHGFEVTELQCFGLEDDREMGRIAGESIIRAASAVDNAEAEALFLSCTALPALPVIAEIERLTGKPVVSSNQASGWAMLRHAGLDAWRPGDYGRLFECDLPVAAKVPA